MKNTSKTDTIIAAKYVEAVGRRRVASARVRIYDVSKKSIIIDNKTLKKGELIVNGRDAADYFPGRTNEKMYKGPLKAAGILDSVAVTVKTQGGGVQGQLDATVHGIARAIDLLSKEHHTSLKSQGFLTRDPRAKERRKAGFAQKARARKQSPKR